MNTIIHLATFFDGGIIKYYPFYNIEDNVNIRRSLPVPNPKRTSSVPSLLISSVRIGESLVSLGKLIDHTSVTRRLLHGTTLGFGFFVLDVLIIQSLNLSKGKGNKETNTTTNTIKPENNTSSYLKNSN